MVGVNCGAGPAATLESVERMAEATDAPLSAQPNAGEPKEVEGRRLVLSSPEFLGSYARRYVAVGVGLVGGCCGTTPVHIARIQQAVSALSAPRPVPASA
jgi:homocysteine S-methyltransferase